MTVEALSRLQASDIKTEDIEEDDQALASKARINQPIEEEKKHDRTADEFIYDQLLVDGKPTNLIDDIAAFNK